MEKKKLWVLEGHVVGKKPIRWNVVFQGPFDNGGPANSYYGTEEQAKTYFSQSLSYEEQNFRIKEYSCVPAIEKKQETEESKEQKRLTAIDKKIKELDKKFNSIKVNLVHSTGNEGLWAVPCTQKDQDRWSNESSNGEEIHVLLCNTPLHPNLRHGDEVVCLTQGTNRPIFYPKEDNPELFENAKKEVIKRAKENQNA